MSTVIYSFTHIYILYTNKFHICTLTVNDLPLCFLYKA